MQLETTAANTALSTVRVERYNKNDGTGRLPRVHTNVNRDSPHYVPNTEAKARAFTTRALPE